MENEKMKADTPRVTVPVDPRVRLAGYVAGTFKYTAWRGAAPEGEPTLTRDISAMLSAAPAPEDGEVVERLRKLAAQWAEAERVVSGTGVNSPRERVPDHVLRNAAADITALLALRAQPPARSGERR